MKKLVVCGLLAAMSVSILAGCGKQQEEVSVKSEVSVVEEVADPHEGQARSQYTGNWIDEKLAAQRPVAVMLANNHASLPQYGMSDADIIYEATMEGEEDRFMCVIQDYKKNKELMPVRSARHYFIYLAEGMDAIYSHYGQSYLAKSDLASSDCNNLNGMEAALSNVTYFRDSSRRAPQNAYTNGDGLIAGIEKKDYRTDLKEGFDSGLVFNEDPEVDITFPEDAEDCAVFKPGFQVSKPWFEYDSEKKVYKRFQFGQKHIDANTNEQLEVKNIIIQFCNTSIADSKHGYLDVDVVDSGKGYYISNGKAIPITWSKESKTAPTEYKLEDGSDLVMNSGKTWICIGRTSYKDQGFTKIYHTMDEFKN